jgi:hypothetical protein
VMPHARFVACFWMLGEERAKLEEWRASVGAEFVASSLDEAATICGREARSRPTQIALTERQELTALSPGTASPEPAAA